MSNKSNTLKPGSVILYLIMGMMALAYMAYAFSKDAVSLAASLASFAVWGRFFKNFGRLSVRAFVKMMDLLGGVTIISLLSIKALRIIVVVMHGFYVETQPYYCYYEFLQ